MDDRLEFVIVNNLGTLTIGQTVMNLDEAETRLLLLQIESAINSIKSRRITNPDWLDKQFMDSRLPTKPAPAVDEDATPPKPVMAAEEDATLPKQHSAQSTGGKKKADANTT